MKLNTNRNHNKQPSQTKKQAKINMIRADNLSAFSRPEHNLRFNENKNTFEMFSLFLLTKIENNQNF